MSKRLQVLVPDDELEAFRAAARAEHLTLSDWVRQALRDVAAERSTAKPDERIEAIRRAATHAFPAPDVEQMLAEIEAGYSATS